jgi:hypothetical protein
MPGVYLLDGLNKTNGEKYSPYGRAKLVLTRNNEGVSGQIFPLLGDKTAPLAVATSISSDGLLTLKIPSRFLELNVRCTVDDDRFICRSLDTQIPIRFFRFNSKSFSEAALTLFQESCGPEYEQIEIRFSTSATRSTLDDMIKELAGLAMVPTTYFPAGPQQSEKGTLGTTLRRAFAQKDKFAEDMQNSFDVPIGLEAYVVKKLREYDGVFNYVNLANSGCGAGEIAFSVVDKNHVFQNGQLSQDNFYSFMTRQLQEFASKDSDGHIRQYRLSNPKISILNLPAIKDAHNPF